MHALWINIIYPSLPGILVVYNLEAVLMDLYITFFLVPVFGSGWKLGANRCISAPRRALGPKLAQIKEPSEVLNIPECFDSTYENRGVS